MKLIDDLLDKWLGPLRLPNNYHIDTDGRFYRWRIEGGYVSILDLPSKRSAARAARSAFIDAQKRIERNSRLWVTVDSEKPT
jgi:hypothetical protein